MKVTAALRDYLKKGKCTAPVQTVVALKAYHRSVLYRAVVNIT